MRGVEKGKNKDFTGPKCQLVFVVNGYYESHIAFVDLIIASSELKINIESTL